jgi:hypothetical protein
MLNSLIDTFLNLDDTNKNKLLTILSNVINPIKIYLIVVILLLLVMCLTNYYIFRNLSKLSNLSISPISQAL